MLNKFLKLFDLKIVKIESKLSLKDIDFDQEEKPVSDIQEPSAVLLEKNKNTFVKEKIEPKKKTSELKIYFLNDKMLSWTSEVDKNNNFPWSDFYTWYWCKETPFFTFKHTSGENIFKRSDIASFEYIRHY